MHDEPALADRVGVGGSRTDGRQAGGSKHRRVTVGKPDGTPRWSLNPSLSREQSPSTWSGVEAGPQEETRGTLSTTFDLLTILIAVRESS